GDPVEDQVELLDDRDRPRALHRPECSHSTTAIGSPASTTDPGFVLTSFTVPAAVAVTRVSIFMASRTATGSPASTTSPGFTSTSSRVPCIGATTARFEPAASADPAPARRPIAGFHSRAVASPTVVAGEPVSPLADTVPDMIESRAPPSTVRVV